MARLARRGDDLVVSLSRWEQLQALRRHVVVPWASVSQMSVVDDVVHQIHGMRLRQLKMVGTYLPGRVAVGTFRDDGRRRIFAAVHRDRPRGLRIVLDGATYGQLLISCADPEAEQRRLAG